MTAKVHVDSQTTPIFHKARPVPYALRAKVEQGLKRLDKQSVIERVEFAEWPAVIVPEAQLKIS